MSSCLQKILFRVEIHISMPVLNFWFFHFFYWKSFTVNCDMSLKSVKDSLLLDYEQGFLVENRTNNPIFDHGEYSRFQLEQVSVEECLSRFRFA